MGMEGLALWRSQLTAQRRHFVSLTTSCASNAATAHPQREGSASDSVPTLRWKLRSLLYSFAPLPELLQAESQARAGNA